MIQIIDGKLTIDGKSGILLNEAAIIVNAVVEQIALKTPGGDVTEKDVEKEIKMLRKIHKERGCSK